MRVDPSPNPGRKDPQPREQEAEAEQGKHPVQGLCNELSAGVFHVGV